MFNHFEGTEIKSGDSYYYCSFVQIIFHLSKTRFILPQIAMQAAKGKYRTFGKYIQNENR